MQPVERSNLSSDLAARLRNRIVDGQLNPDARLNEVRLAAELDVSRTPLREALTVLAAEGFVRSIPRRGFFVTPLSLEEFRQLYRMRALLDPAALEDAGLPSGQQLKRLDELNQSIANSSDPTRIIELDDEWHQVLLEGCPNRILMGLITQFMQRTRRYEHAYMREATHVEVALEEHENILKACRRGDLPAACEALRRNMQSGIEPLMDWLAAREARATKNP